jgi:hypothetical protein
VSWLIHEANIGPTRYPNPAATRPICSIPFAKSRMKKRIMFGNMAWTSSMPTIMVTGNPMRLAP